MYTKAGEWLGPSSCSAHTALPSALFERPGRCLAGCLPPTHPLRFHPLGGRTQASGRRHKRWRAATCPRPSCSASTRSARATPRPRATGGRRSGGTPRRAASTRQSPCIGTAGAPHGGGFVGVGCAAGWRALRDWLAVKPCSGHAASRDLPTPGATPTPAHRQWADFLRVVREHRRDGLPAAHGVVAAALAAEGQWREAERHFVEARDWEGAVGMYK
jgi:hypothetical protein